MRKHFWSSVTILQGNMSYRDPPPQFNNKMLSFKTGGPQKNYLQGNMSYRDPPPKFNNKMLSFKTGGPQKNYCFI